MLATINKKFDLKALLVSLLVVIVLTTINSSYEQSNNSRNLQSELLDSLVSEIIAIIGSILALGVSALIAWLRNKGLPVTSEQEAMFREIVTSRFQKLAKDSWIIIREHPEKLNEYWSDLSKGKMPLEFQNKLRDEGMQFAIKLKDNREFRDFAKNLSATGMEKLLKDLRVNLKNDYQQRMLDVIPKLVSIAVDAAFESDVKDIKTWSKKSLENLKPLLLSAEAIDTEDNLMIIIRSEINKRIQQRIGLNN